MALHGQHVLTGSSDGWIRVWDVADALEVGGIGTVQTLALILGWVVLVVVARVLSLRDLRKRQKAARQTKLERKEFLQKESCCENIFFDASPDCPNPV